MAGMPPKDGVVRSPLPAIHALELAAQSKTWMPGTRPGMTADAGRPVAKLKVMCARSMHVAVGALGQAFAQAPGHEVEFDFGTVGALQTKLDAGETADVVDPLGRRHRQARAGRRGGARLAARTSPGPSSRSASARARRSPDFSTVEAFKRLLEDARPSPPAIRRSAVRRACISTARSSEAGLGRDDGAEGHAAEDRRRGRQARGRGQGRVRADAVGRGRVGARRGDRGPAAGPVRPGHDLLRGGDGGERRQATRPQPSSRR